MPYHVREWVEVAIELGHEITVVTAIDPEFLKSIDWNKKVDVRQVEYPGCGIRNFFRLQKNFKQVIFDVILRDNPDLIYERFSSISMVTAKVAKKTGTPYTTEINGIIDEELATAEISLFRRYFFKQIQKYVYKRVTKIITVTNQIKQYIAYNYNIDFNRIKSFSNGVNTKRFQLNDSHNSRQLYDIPENRFVVGYLGSLFPWYDIDILIRNCLKIAEDVPNIIFLIGGGQEPMLSDLKDKVKQKGIEDFFIFMGQIHWDQAGTFTSTFDIAVAPIKFNDHQYEVSPLKIASYMACEQFILASQMKGMSDLIQESKCGLIYENDTDFVNKIIKISKMTIDERRKMGRNGRKCVEDNYSWGKIVKESLDWIMDKVQ